MSASDRSTSTGTECSSAQKPSYTFQTWQRLKNVCQALRQTEDKVRNLKSEIEAKLKSTERMREKRAELQACRISVQSLESQLEWRRANARTVAVRLTKARHRAADVQIRMNNFCTDIEEMKTDLAEKQRIYIGVREKLILAAAQLFMRRRQMVQELRAIIFVEPMTPVTLQPTTKGSSSLVCNCKMPLKIINIHLPDAEDYYGHNDIDLSVGLSFAVQALIALSRIFDFSLRYQFEFFGSRSFVSDLINPELPSNQRVFPLHSRNQDKVAFQYGVFLLNKNLAQLRCDCGTFTQDLRCTLANLRSLYDHLADAKLEPYMYITRAMRLADSASDDVTFTSSTQRKSPSISSGALSTDSGDHSFRLEIPPSKLAAVSASHSDPVIKNSDRDHSETDEHFNLPEPIYATDSKKGRTKNDNDGIDRSNSGLTPVSREDYLDFTLENLNGNANRVVNKELLRTCYLTADDELSTLTDQNEENGESIGKGHSAYLNSTNVQ